MRSGVVILVCILAVTCTSCDRPFREVEPPAIEVLHPDANQILLTEATGVRLRTSSFRDVQRVTIGDRVASFDSTTGEWRDTLLLRVGLNTFALRAQDVLGTVRTDTLRLVRARVVDSDPAVETPFALGGHTATLLDDGQVLISGGSSRYGGVASRDAFLMTEDGAARRIVQGLQVARTGHTSVRLPDGRVLIAGGSRVGEVNQLADVVTEVEMFDPASRVFTRVPVSGAPVSRAFHSVAAYRDGDEVLIDFFGGYGDVSFGGGARLGTRRDIGTYMLRNDTLIAVGNPLSGVLLDPMAGHTQVSLTGARDRREEVSFVFGTRFSGLQQQTLSLVLDFRVRPGAIEAYDAPGYAKPRTRHASASPRPGAALLLGGMSNEPDLLVRVAESYIHEARRVFRFPSGVLDVQTFGHSATKLPDGRILVIGGFGTDLVARPTGRFLRVLI